MRNYRHIEVRPIAGALGAEIHGVDMARDLEADVVAEMRQAFLDHLVIFLRDQVVTPQQQLAFARKFGDPVEYPQLTGLPEAARRILNSQVRIGRPLGIQGLPESAKSPAFSASLGLLIYPQVAGIEHFEPRRSNVMKGTGTDGYISRVGRWLRESF